MVTNAPEQAVMKSIHFEFLRKHNQALADLGGFAETYAHDDPESSLVKCRKLAEELVELTYRKYRLVRPNPAVGRVPTLKECLYAESFTKLCPPAIVAELDRVRHITNAGAHKTSDKPEPPTVATALDALQRTWRLAAWFADFFGWAKAAEAGAWNPPQQGGAMALSKGQLQREKKEALQRLEDIEAELDRARQAAAKEQRVRSTVEAALRRTQEELEALRQRGREAVGVLRFSEQESRVWLVDKMLADAGWDLTDADQVGREIDLGAAGRADYVLWDESGSPLAVIEAKRTDTDPAAGRAQAIDYADALEKRSGRRPVILLTNGLETWIWDDRAASPPRRVFGIHARRSLERLIARRDHLDLGALSTLPPSREIAGRIYQVAALKHVCATFVRGGRKALLVQATGTGKTRVAVSLCELLMRHGLVQRVLFLCDRIALRKQAADAFAEHLKAEPLTYVGTTQDQQVDGEAEDGAAFEAGKSDRERRVHLATYPSMMRAMRRFDVGFFDLIIADESHRSIYNRYRDLFLYFDALQVGLTATPVGHLDRNTYKLFDCPDQNPTFAYEFDEAVQESFLVPFRPVRHDTHFLREGVRWEELSEDERRRIEETDGDAAGADYEPADIDRKILIEGTTRRMWDVLFDKGIRDADDVLPGKTIVFARSHRHAVFMKKVFDSAWPQYQRDRLCEVIDNLTPRAATLIESFKRKQSAPRIAISVDMLDTGVDVPEVVNLVFARPVRSIVKFWQMLGRGTRTCDDLFGPGRHKTEFAVIDHWGNFEHFGTTGPSGHEDVGLSTPLRQRLFLARMSLADAALAAGDGRGLALAVGLVASDLNALLDSPSLSVQEHRGDLVALADADALARWDPKLRAGLRERAAPLARWLEVYGEEAAWRFDLLVAEVQAAVVAQSEAAEPLRARLFAHLDRLPRSVRQVAERAPVLDALREETFWHEPDVVGALDETRKALRGLMKILDEMRPDPLVPRTLRLEDRDDRVDERPVAVLAGTELAAWRQRVRDLLGRHFADNPVLRRIRDGSVISEADLESLAALVHTVDPAVNLRYLPTQLNAKGGLVRVLRGLVGMDAAAVERAFEGYVHAHPELTALQLQFLVLVKRHIAAQGGIELDELYAEPFTRFDAASVDGVFREGRQVDDLLDLLTRFSVLSPNESNVA